MKENRVGVVIFRCRNGEDFKCRVTSQVCQGFGRAGRRVGGFNMTSRLFSQRNQNDRKKIAVSSIVTVCLSTEPWNEVEFFCPVCFVLVFFFPPDRQQPALAKWKRIRHVHNKLHL